MPSKKKRNRLRNLVFTLNNYNQDDESHLQAIECRYLVYGREIGASGNKHLQGYLELLNQKTFTAVHTLLGGHAHIEPRKGSPQQAADYCKKDGDYFEKGNISAPGKRNDIEDLYEDLKQGKSDLELQERHLMPYVRYHKAVDRLRLNLLRAQAGFEPVQVLVLYGDAGSGKTKRAYELDPNLYHWMPQENGNWFDGYYGQETLLIDDFYGGIKYSYLLNLLDGYKFNLPIKGGFTWKCWRRVIITSNVHPREWYSKGLTPALARRLTEITQVVV